jgi:large subunit ribosomal protein L25
MENIVLNANERKTITKPALNAIRNNKRVPGTFYLKNTKPVAIDVLEKELNPLVFTAETHLISLMVQGYDEHDCIIKDVQFDPVTDRVVHFDLLGLVKGEMFQLEVPIKYHGSAIGIKEGGILQQVLHKLEIECLPKDIPQHLNIDVTDIKLGAAIHAGDLKFDNVTILTPADAVVVTVTHPKVEKEPVVEELVEGALEPDVIPKGKAEEEEEKGKEKEKEKGKEKEKEKK